MPIHVTEYIGIIKKQTTKTDFNISPIAKDVFTKIYEINYYIKELYFCHTH